MADPKDHMTLALSKKEMARWLAPCQMVRPEEYSCKLRQLRLTLAECLYIMSETPEMGWRWQERVVREYIKLEQEHVPKPKHCTRRDCLIRRAQLDDEEGCSCP